MIEQNNTIHHQPNGYPSAVSGFTLIELMISLVLGLLISAAVIQVYLINTRTITVQQSASEVQDSAIFAMQSLEEHIRITNLGNPITSISDKTNHGGVVLTKNNLGSSNATDAQYFTASTGSTDWTGLSNIDGVGSDQLTIQYKNITSNILYDCEGSKIDANSKDWVVERYFIRLSGSTAGELALACDAGRVKDNGVITSAFTGNGEIVVSAIEQFKVLLGTQTGVDELTYLPAKTYLELTDKPAITTVKIGVIVRSDTPLIADADKETFTLLGKEQTLKADSTRKKYYRRGYESTVLLRNARVMALTGVSASK
ncbi:MULTISPECIES: PilW family protein [unclassified Psychrobacter]|uniref:PilW family protein n=1 Tax=unclassified Psychrobacter TaxID=196806 RepID=UPI0025B3922E|nr:MULTISPECIES: PilW family protein [unclassified Psychrobacter]MDN3454205.1 PilW family protein [Psychrobacter sp. APC 3350]MDN3501394.1 PilW family protein [Psychrobacter sp. 5A.1]